jgi:hypothetical protein
MREYTQNTEALALLYANGELEGPELADFEGRLAADQSARDALCQAVELAATLSGRAPQMPNAAYRNSVRRRLMPVGAWGWLSRRRLYRGHPAFWALAGAAAAAILFVAWPARAPDPTLQPVADVARTAPAGDQPSRPATPLDAEANVYTELSNFNHLASTVAEVKGHRDRWVPKRPAPADARAPKTSM